MNSEIMRQAAQDLAEKQQLKAYKRAWRVIQERYGQEETPVRNVLEDFQRVLGDWA